MASIGGSPACSHIAPQQRKTCSYNRQLVWSSTRAGVYRPPNHLNKEVGDLPQQGGGNTGVCQAVPDPGLQVWFYCGCVTV